jgi:glycosyltransferase involved in cell wall biosynthesis
MPGALVRSVEAYSPKSRVECGSRTRPARLLARMNRGACGSNIRIGTPIFWRFIAEHGISNAMYRGYFPRERLRYSLSVGDAHLISLRAPFVGISVPGKLYGIMASGRPAIFVGPEKSESGETVREAECGVVVDPGSAGAAGRIVETLREWSGRNGKATEHGQRGRAAFLRDYERDACCREWRSVIESAWRQLAGPPRRR